MRSPLYKYRSTQNYTAVRRENEAKKCHCLRPVNRRYVLDKYLLHDSFFSAIFLLESRDADAFFALLIFKVEWKRETERVKKTPGKSLIDWK